MFDRIATRYDLMNSVMSAGLHHRWRSRAADLASLHEGETALDVCCGTGDLAFELKRRVGSDGTVIGLDFSEPMLALARAKAARLGVVAEFRRGNALALPFADSSFDGATVGFGVRNLVDLKSGVLELARVVRSDRKVVILEITTPARPPLSWFYGLWFDRIVPMLGAVAGDRDAYSYLPQSVKRFPPALELAELMHVCGLRDVRFVLLAGGIVAIHVGTVAATSSGAGAGS
jgi:demethylmenaquinone methyltransferase/2-methoxy-6-polyprenyl-1,4-benzoquinol methylase